MGKRKGRSVRKNKQVGAGPAGQEPDDLVRAPHSFVVHRGKVCNLSELCISVS